MEPSDPNRLNQIRIGNVLGLPGRSLNREQAL